MRDKLSVDCATIKRMKIAFYLSVAVMLLPFIASAALVPCRGVECQACHLIVLGQGLLNWLIGILIVVIGVIAAVAGFRMVMSAGNPGGVTQAKSMFMNAFVGLIILLIAWLAIDTVMKQLTKFDPAYDGSDQARFGPWNQIQCTAPITAPAVAPNNAAGGTGTSDLDVNGTGYTQAEAEAEINRLNGRLNTNIQVVSSGNCSDRSNPQCTSLQGLSSQALERTVILAATCPDCNMSITAGTEVGHQNSCHAAGSCTDIDCATTCTPQQITSIVQFANTMNSRLPENQGIVRAVYEVATPERRTELINQGVPADSIAVVPWIRGNGDGEHFSVYTETE